MFPKEVVEEKLDEEKVNQLVKELTEKLNIQDSTCKLDLTSLREYLQKEAAPSFNFSDSSYASIRKQFYASLVESQRSEEGSQNAKELRLDETYFEKLAVNVTGSPESMPQGTAPNNDETALKLKQCLEQGPVNVKQGPSFQYQFGGALTKDTGRYCKPVLPWWCQMDGATNSTLITNTAPCQTLIFSGTNAGITHSAECPAQEAAKSSGEEKNCSTGKSRPS